MRLPRDGFQGFEIRRRILPRPNRRAIHDTDVGCGRLAGRFKRGRPQTRLLTPARCLTSSPAA
jgi:hypothetical protein